MNSINNTDAKVWTVWIDETGKIISTKKIPGAKQINFENDNIGIQRVSELVLKGYRIC